MGKNLNLKQRKLLLNIVLICGIISFICGVVLLYGAATDPSANISESSVVYLLLAGVFFPIYALVAKAGLPKK